MADTLRRISDRNRAEGDTVARFARREGDTWLEAFVAQMLRSPSIRRAVITALWGAGLGSLLTFTVYRITLAAEVQEVRNATDGRFAKIAGEINLHTARLDTLEARASRAGSAVGMLLRAECSRTSLYDQGRLDMVCPSHLHRDAPR